MNPQTWLVCSFASVPKALLRLLVSDAGSHDFAGFRPRLRKGLRRR